MTGENPNVAAMLVEHSERLGEKTALVDLTRGPARRLSYRDLQRSVAAFAGMLGAKGVGSGDRVLVFVPMSAELYVVMLGVLHLGATAVFVDAWADRRRLDQAVEAAAPRAFVGSWKGQALRLMSPAIRRLPLHFVADGLLLKGRTSDEPVAVVSPEAPALVTLTTGSTGPPRAAARSHAFLWAQHRALSGLMRLQSDDVDLTTLPIFVLNNLALGITSVLPRLDPRRPAEFDPAALYLQLLEERVTTAGGSPAFFERLTSWANARGRRLPLRALFTGGAPVTPTLARQIVQCTSGEATVVYGSTEAEPISGIVMSELIEASEIETGSAGICVGKPVPEVDVRLIRPCDDPIGLGDGGWEEWEVDAGEVGEIVVAGEHVLTGYLNDPEGDHRSKIRDGTRVWHRTGDAASLDSVGRLWLQGRVGDRLVRGGRTYWSLPVELGAMSVAGVRHAAYLGMPSREAMGGRAVLCVETGENRLSSVTSEMLLASVGEAPVDEIVALRKIPRDPRHASKTDRIGLRSVLARKPIASGSRWRSQSKA